MHRKSEKFFIAAVVNGYAVRDVAGLETGKIN
jgi:hypothetical protein